jgi:signal transduction histidine kinase
MACEASTLSDPPLTRLARLSPAVMFCQRPDLGVVFATGPIEEVTGLTAEEWLNQPPARFWQVVHEADAGDLRKSVERAATSREIILSTYRLRPLGTRRVVCVQERRRAVRGPDGTLVGFDGIWLDVTRQTLEEKLRSDPSWPETQSRLADVLVHDFNNQVTAIHALAESLQLQLEAGHPFLESLQIIGNNATQARQTILRIVDLARHRGAATFHDLNDLAGEGQELARKLVSRRVQFETALAAEALPVYADAVALRRVVVELVLQAANRLPAGGTLRVATARQTAPPAQPLRLGRAPRLPAVCLAVTAAGVQLSADQLGELMSPLSVAKPLAEISGLEFYRTAQLVETLHGAVTIESGAASGTTLRVWLPEADFSESGGRERAA